MMGKRADAELRWTDARPTPQAELFEPNIVRFEEVVAPQEGAGEERTGRPGRGRPVEGGAGVSA